MKKNYRWLYLPVEVKVREMDAKLLLAYYAVKSDYHVIIGDHVMVEKASEKYPKGIFFSKGGPHGFRERIITQAIKNNHKVVELDEEGLIFNEKLYIIDRMRKDMLELVTQEYCWGEYQKEVIAKYHPDLINKCHVVGNPRLDLLTPKYRELYREDVENLKNSYGDFILINTRFAKYNTLKGKKETALNQEIKRLYDCFIEMIHKLSKQFSNITIIIRPHPLENSTSYRKEFANYSNVHVIHEGNIIKWLMAAKAIIHNGCTSGIEAFFLERPLITYIPFQSNETIISNQLGEKARNINEIITYLKNIFSNNYKVDLQKGSEVFKYCYWSKDHYAYSSILQLCNQISLSSPPLKEFSFIQYQYKKKRIFSLTHSEILSFFNKLNEIEGIQSFISIQSIGKNIYLIHST